MEMESPNESSFEHAGESLTQVTSSDRDRRTAEILQKALSLQALGFLGYKDGKQVTFDMAQELANIPDRNYNQNNGIICFKLEDSVYAMPANETSLEELQATGFQRNQYIGVPHLNEDEVWGSNARTGSGYQQWRELADRNERHLTALRDAKEEESA